LTVNAKEPIKKEEKKIEDDPLVCEGCSLRCGKKERKHQEMADTTEQYEPLLKWLLDRIVGAIEKKKK